MPLEKPGLWTADIAGIDPRWRSMWVGLEAMWILNENSGAPYSHGHQKMGSTNTFPWATTPYGPALLGDGIGTCFVDNPDALNFFDEPLNSGFTVRTIFNRTGGSNFDGVFSSGSGGGGGDWQFWCGAATSTTFRMSHRATGATNLDATFATDGTYYDAVYTFDGSGPISRLYLDGVEKASDAVITEPDNDPAGRAVRIGRFLDDNGEWEGNIVGVWVWSRALSPTEITALYRDPFGMTHLQQPFVSGGLTATLLATADGTIVDVVNELDAASPLFSSIDEDIDASDDTDYVNNAVLPVSPGWKKVQQQDNKASTTSITATYDLTPTEGNLLVAVFGYRDANNDPSSPPSGWSKAVSINAFSSTIGVWYKVAGASESTAVVFSWDASSRHASLGIFEYSGNATSSPFDVGAGEDGGSPGRTTLSSGTTAPTAEDDELWIAGFVVRDATTNDFTSFSNSFSEILDVEHNEALGVGHRLEADIAAAETTAVWDHSDRVAGCIATFKPAGAFVRFYPLLTDLPEAFGVAVSGTIRTKIRGFNFWGQSLTLLAQLYKEDETTALSDEITVDTVSANSAFSITAPLVFTGLDTSAGKPAWNGARLRFRWA